MSIDIGTITLVLSFLYIMQVLALFIQWRLDRLHSGPGWWAAGITFLGLGFAFATLRVFPQFALIGTLVNLPLYLTALVLLYIGLLKFFNQKVPWPGLAAFLIFFVIEHAFFTLVINSLTVRRLVFNLATIYISVLCAWFLFRRAAGSIRASAMLVGAVFALHGVDFLGATILIFFNPIPANVLSASPDVILAYFDAIFIGTMWTFGFILMVNQRLSAENREESENRQRIFNTSPDSVIITHFENDQITEVNDGFVAATGYTRQEVLGKSLSAINLIKNPEDLKIIDDKVRQMGQCENVEVIFVRKNGSEFTVMLSARKIDLHSEPHTLSVSRDISDRKRLEEELTKEAISDNLTGLYNRRYFMNVAQSELTRCLRFSHLLTVALLDLDYFKQINDTYGHQAGDQALITFTQICKTNIRSMDVMARIGGDEFALLFPESNQEQAFLIIERIRQTSAASGLNLDGKEVVISFSAGIASLTGSENTLSTLLARADQNLYQAKLAGRSQTIYEKLASSQ